MRLPDLARTSLSFSWRAVRVAPGLATVAVISLALAVGLVICVTVVLDTLVWKPLRVPAPDRLMALHVETNGEQTGFSIPDYLSLTSHGDRRTGAMAWVDGLVVNVETPARLQLANVWLVSDDFFDTLGEQPVLGRLFAPQREDSAEGGDAIISHDVWMRDFGGRASAIGEQVRVEGSPFTIIGVTAPPYTGLTRVAAPAITLRLADAAHLATPLGLPERLVDDPSWTGLGVGVRVPDGIAHAAACADLTSRWAAVQSSSGRTAASDGRRRLTCTDISRGINADQLQQLARPVRAVLLLAILLLGVGCLHIAELFLLTISAKRHDLTLRLMLGAPRASILAHVFTLVTGISLVAAAAGALVAIVVSPHAAYAFLDRAYVRPTLDLTLDARLVAWAIGTTMGMVLLCAIPVLVSTARLRPETIGMTGAARTTARLRWPTRILIGGQTAAAVGLLLSSSTLVEAVRTWTMGESQRTAGLFVAHLYPQPRGYVAMDGPAYYPRVVTNVQAIPGVERVALTNHEPGGAFIHERTLATADRTRSRTAGVVAASPGLFATLDVPLLQGRDVAWSDTKEAEPVIVLSRGLAETLFAGASPLDKYVRLDPDTPGRAMRIVGVVSDSNVFDVRRPGIAVAYTAWLQADYTQWAARLLVRTPALPRESGIDAAVTSLGREYVLWSGSSADVTRRALTVERVVARAAAILAGVSTVLLALGVFAAVAHLMARRTRETAIRLALGARARHIYGDALTMMAVPTLAGTIAGVPIWWNADRWVRVAIERLPPVHPLFLIAVPCAAAALVVGATLVATRRANNGWSIDAALRPET